MREEQNAAHEASGYARAAGEPGVCVATSGPGATNLITGIATAYMDSIPLVAITGQVNQWLFGRDVFQEPTSPARANLYQHSYLVKDAADLRASLKRLLRLRRPAVPARFSLMCRPTCKTKLRLS